MATRRAALGQRSRPERRGGDRFHRGPDAPAWSTVPGRSIRTAIEESHELARLGTARKPPTAPRGDAISETGCRRRRPPYRRRFLMFTTATATARITIAVTITPRDPLPLDPFPFPRPRRTEWNGTALMLRRIQSAPSRGRPTGAPDRVTKPAGCAEQTGGLRSAPATARAVRGPGRRQ